MTAYTLPPPTNSLTDMTNDALLLVQSLGLQLDDKLPKRVVAPAFNNWQEAIQQIPTVLQCGAKTCNWDLPG